MHAIILAAVTALTAAPPGLAPAPGPLRLDLRTAEARADYDRSHLEGSSVERPYQPRTAVDHRFSPDGLTSAAGYLCGIGGIGPDGDGTRGGPASAFGTFGRFLGATIAYPIR